MANCKNYLTLIVLASFISIFSYAQPDGEKPVSSQSPKSEVKVNIDTKDILNGKDTLKVQLFQLNKETQNDKPWKIALLVGILTFTATIVSSLINRWITLKGIMTNKEIAVSQIANSQKAILHDFNSTLKTKNRQEWVNDVRNSLGEFIANCVKLNVEFQDPGADNKQKIKDIHEKIILNRTKLRLLLNPQKELHNNLLNSIKSFIDIFDNQVLNFRNNKTEFKNLDLQKASDKIVEDGRRLLYSEWQKIQNLTD